MMEDVLIPLAMILIVGGMIFGLIFGVSISVKNDNQYAMFKERHGEIMNRDQYVRYLDDNNNPEQQEELKNLTQGKMKLRDSEYFRHLIKVGIDEAEVMDDLDAAEPEDKVSEPIKPPIRSIKPPSDPGSFYALWKAYETESGVTEAILGEEAFYELFYDDVVPKFSSSWAAYYTITKNPNEISKESFYKLLNSKKLR
jgi:hypothetical protein